MSRAEQRKRIGARIKSAREAMGVSQGVLARWLRISPSSISNYETGARPVLAEDLAEIAALLKVPMSSLAGDADEEEWDDMEAARFYRGVPTALKPTARAMLKSLAQQDDRE